MVSLVSWVLNTVGGSWTGSRRFGGLLVLYPTSFSVMASTPAWVARCGRGAVSYMQPRSHLNSELASLRFLRVFGVPPSLTYTIRSPVEQCSNSIALLILYTVLTEAS